MDKKREIKKGSSNNNEVKKDTGKTTQTKQNTKTKYTNKEKDQLVIILLVIVIAIVVIFLFSNSRNISNKDRNMEVQNEQNNISVEGNAEVNKNKGVIESKQIDDFKIDNIQVKKENDITYIFADVTNTGNASKGDFRVYISMKDENDKEIIGFEQDLPVLSPGEKTNISIGSTEEFVNAYKCTITKVEK